MQKKIIITFLMICVYSVKSEEVKKKSELRKPVSEADINIKIAKLYKQANELVSQYKPKIIPQKYVWNNQRKQSIAIPQLYLWPNENLQAQYNSLMMKINNLLAKINKQSPYLPI